MCQVLLGEECQLSVTVPNRCFQARWPKLPLVLAVEVGPHRAPPSSAGGHFLLTEAVSEIFEEPWQKLNYSRVGGTRHTTQVHPLATTSPEPWGESSHLSHSPH